jgi:hypothetical protein
MKRVSIQALSGYFRKALGTPRPSSLRFDRDGSFANERETLEQLTALLGFARGFVVDIAASDGLTQSSTVGFFSSMDWRGLAVEMDPIKFSHLAHTYAAFGGSQLARTRITPKNIVSTLDAFETPRDFEVFNLDIDSYDLRVLEACLKAGFRPSIVSLEINEKIPAGVFFTVEYDEHHFWNGDHFYGCSVDAACEVVKPFGYILWKVEYNNAFFVNSKVSLPGMADLPGGLAWQAGYRDAPDRRALFPWNEDVEHWLALRPDDAVHSIQAFFSPYEGKFSIRLA